MLQSHGAVSYPSAAVSVSYCIHSSDCSKYTPRLQSRVWLDTSECNKYTPQFQSRVWLDTNQYSVKHTR